MVDPAIDNGRYWNEIAAAYQDITRISCGDFHYGPLLPGDSELQLLPPQLAGKRCLELACGAGQNSVVLARHGADCTAVDISAEQLAVGRQLATQNQVQIDFRTAAMESLPDNLGRFDLIHSSFGLPFAANPARLVQTLVDKFLNPGGELLFSVAHPVFAGEWLEIEDVGEGIFVTDYFQPPPDIRWSEMDDDLFVQSYYYPVSTVIDWHLQAGLQVTAVREPQALPIPTMSEAEIRNQVPYDSPAWRELYPQIAKVPVVLIVRARSLKLASTPG